MRILFVAFALLIQFSWAIFAQEDISKPVSVKLDSIFHLFQETLKKPYPDFTAISLTGDTLTEKDLLGKITFIDFWFNSCSPCVAAFGDIENVYKKLKDNPRFQFISFCTDPIDWAKESAKKYQLPYPVYPIKRQQFSTLLLSGFPFMLIVNEEGKIIYYKTGGFSEKVSSERTKEFQNIENILMTELSK